MEILPIIVLYVLAMAVECSVGPSVPDCEYDGADAPSSITVREGWTFSLDCNSSGNPTPSLTWTHPGPGPSSPLTLSNIQKSSPRVSHTSPTILNVTAGTSSSATLTFNFIAYPRPSASDVTWERHDLQTDHWTVLFNTSDIAITLSQNSLQTNISFIDVKEINFGQYRVNVSNELGSITDTFFLKPEGVPSVPHNLKSSDRVTESSVNLTWISGFDGGHPQTFVVQFRDISTVIWKKEDVETGHTNHTLFNLKPGTTYEVKVTARNSLGNSASSDTITLTTLSVIEDHTETSPNTVGGAIGGAIGAIAAVVIVVVILRRKYFLHRNASILKNTYHGDNRSYNLHVNMPLNESSSKSQMYHAENVKKENPIYKYTRVKNPEETVL
ncbi:TUTL-like protein [Mya arenaria]|uniref:TUTL-like protein n=1 Tax=Mya arenaria TaxID=6604 RepID=A0ABY7DP12_MYAAR|nr:TUTL-like protein [Mya arenaria]